MSFRHLVIVSLLVAAAAIPLQISGGAEYPTVPPGAIILAVIALVVLAVRRWWVLIAPVVVTAALFVGAVLTPNVGDNLEAGGFARAGGTVIQLVAMGVALVAAVLGLVAERRHLSHRPPASRR
ncbi:hypothetical protein G5C66_17420 [Nocardioides sp. KC13]|uniref:Uncharacterized protein n=1 Tax=Nocardioides turkmenicus TaxID=2711220 RepID=A0A6M1R3H9_9ACTN|nr:hypothetical protein [Nocardioides sp. KC13]